ncbi:MAG: hypothetical protein U1F24_13235 [Alphaproteobacteria bacterium]
MMALDGKVSTRSSFPGGGGDLRGIARLIAYGPPPPAAPAADRRADRGRRRPAPAAPAASARCCPIILLGTGLWDEAANGAEGALARGVFAAPEPSTRQSFGARFGEHFGYRPPRVASLGYDAVSLAATLSTICRAFTKEASPIPAASRAWTAFPLPAERHDPAGAWRSSR